MAEVTRSERVTPRMPPAFTLISSTGEKPARGVPPPGASGSGRGEGGTVLTGRNALQSAPKAQAIGGFAHEGDDVGDVLLERHTELRRATVKVVSRDGAGKGLVLHSLEH